MASSRPHLQEAPLEEASPPSSTGITPRLSALDGLTGPSNKIPKLVLDEDVSSSRREKPAEPAPPVSQGGASDAAEIPEVSEDSSDEGMARLMRMQQRRTRPSSASAPANRPSAAPPPPRAKLGNLDASAGDADWNVAGKPPRRPRASGGAAAATAAARKKPEKPADEPPPSDSDEDDDFYSEYSASKAGRSTAKHGKTYNVALTRSMAIAKRDAQRRR